MQDLRQRYVLVTGASGYIGQRLAQHLAGEGRRVAGTWLSNPVDLPGVETVPVDLTDGGAVRRLLRDMRPGAIVHLAAITNVAQCEADPAEARAVIVEATEHLCRHGKEFVPDAPLIALSTDLVFDGTAAPYDEAAPAKPLNLYGSLKSEAEDKVLAHEGGVVLRSALVYGPPSGRKFSFLGWILDAIKQSKPLELFRDEWRTPVFVEDLVRGAALLLEGKHRGVFHAGGPERLSRVEMGRRICEVFALDPAAVREANRADVPGGQLRARDASLISDRLIALGWKQTSFEDGLTICRDSMAPG